MTRAATSRRAWQRAAAPASREALVPRIVIFVALATIVVGSVLGGHRLGVATPPFVANWAPALHPRAALAALALAAAVLAAPRLLTLRPATFAVAIYALPLALGLALNACRLGPAGWSAVFDLQRGGEAANEYLPGLPTLSYGVHFYLDHFAELVPSQPVNVAGHPPGPLLLMHALGVHTAAGLAALCIGLGSLTAPFTYALSGSRVAALLVAFSPVVLLDGVTSFDYVFAALGTGAAALLVRHRIVGALALAVASLFSWALLAVGAWVVLARRDLRTAIACALAVIAVNALLATTGYDPIGALRATSAVYHHSLATQRPYAYWVFGSIVAWGVMLGPPIALRIRDPALLTVLAIATVGGFTKAETERIWLFLVPFACMAAAPHITRLRLTLALLAAQALVVEVLFATVW